MSADSDSTDAIPRQATTIRSRQFVLTWLSTWLIFLGFYFLLPTLPGYFVNELHGKQSQVGWIIGLFTLSAMALRPISGRLADTRGKPWTMLLGASLLTATVVFYWWVKTPTTLLTLRFFHGIGWAIYLTGAVSLISDIAHPTQRATMTGHYFLANTLAMVVGPWLGVLILNHSNYTVLFSASIGLTAIALPIVWPLHREAEPVAHKVNGRWFSPKAWLPSTTLGFAAFTYGGIVSFLPLYDESHVGLFFAVYAVSLGLSRPVCGYVADKLGRHVVILPCMLLVALSMCGLAWKSSAAGLVAVAIVYGIAMGGAGPALNAFTIDRVPPEERGAAMGMYTAMFELGLALGSVVLGFVLDHGGFVKMWLVAAVAPVIGFGLFAAGWRRR